MPVVRDSGVATEALLDNGSPVVEVHRSFSSGAPAINVDGMLSATVRMLPSHRPTLTTPEWLLDRLTLLKLPDW